MAGFNYELGRSNNMVAAEEAGKITIGRWAKRFRVSARAAVAIMRPSEAHHTGTGRRGKSRLTPVIEGDREPTSDQLAAMREFDRAAKAARSAPPLTRCVIRWLEWPGFSSRLGRFRRGADRTPLERIERDVTVSLDKNGVPLDKAYRTGSGLVVAHKGKVIFTNCNPQFDNAATIATRICQSGE